MYKVSQGCPITSYAKVVTNRAKIHYLKFTAKLLFKKVNGGFTINNFNIIYIN